MKVQKSFIVVLVLTAVMSASELFGAETGGSVQTVAGGGVTVKVAYLNPGSDDDPRFQVVLDTHSVALDGYDLKSLAYLLDDSGKSHSPKALESKGGGHHRQVVLTFPRLSSQAKRIEVVIKDVAGVKERKFRWDLR